ncbi:hypothetical protein D0B54_20950 [Solimonas sp. K1W22B-7]|uniref:heme-binding protein n=1 Tax=Solimonas sp. K1W22B-7 TaxID=2303331 RepID=UPI000E32E677|nr:heme-binding protein [Solimonas sp. K1W22B-7]AXQ30997.1 hypothetical protein D0B54_20950 [Solimonas sp. K1W22B-7]
MKPRWLAWPLAALLAACGGGGGPSDDSGCTGSCATSNPQRLEVADVQRVIAQAVDEADARGALATIAVTDRVGNVLAVFQMTGADPALTVRSGRNTGTGLDGLTDVVPSSLGAIAKAVTGAYLSSEGNAFSTRTASQIVQDHFNPKERDQPGGPLFGVQFSQLPCSDLTLRLADATSAGPKRSPLGLSADAGGFPLYKAGTVVGGVGVIADGVYGLDLDIRGNDSDLDELIATAATAGFDAPQDRRANRITAGGLSLRYSDVGQSQTATGGRSTLTFAQASAQGSLLSVSGYYLAPAIGTGTRFGQAESGYQPSTVPAFADLDAFELVNGAPRFPPIAGTDGLLTQAEVTSVLRNALLNANHLRAQIRRPVGSLMRGTVSVVDTSGVILGVLRTRDAPVFGTDVSLQKARSALFFSSPTLGADLNAAGSVSYFIPDLGTATTPPVSFADYATALSAQLSPATLTGGFAFGARSIGNVARPFFPDGVEETGPGALSKPFARWSPFSTGLQLDLVYERIVQHVGFVAGLGVPDVGVGCSGPPAPALGFATTVPAKLDNGLQIFAGGVPIYRGNTLIGAVGVSGDGIDQDDLVAFLGVDGAARATGTLGNAPRALRIDTLDVPGGRLRYVQCPQAPFVDTDAQNVCQGK